MGGVKAVRPGSGIGVPIFEIKDLRQTAFDDLGRAQKIGGIFRQLSPDPSPVGDREESGIGPERIVVLDPLSDREGWVFDLDRPKCAGEPEGKCVAKISGGPESGFHFVRESLALSDTQTLFP
jgi:hypothetical protein